ncbi:hypothetical protein [Viridibacterium curvum]|uniref:Uncharacterized protein n=1 Tax=Viridibacterium curvum TaxID=1101404 RepID=A0ABP9R000_9RHOO
MGAPDSLGTLADIAAACDARALAATLLAITRYAEFPSRAAQEVVACHLDCVADEDACDNATRAIASLLSRCWLYGEIARTGQ